MEKAIKSIILAAGKGTRMKSQTPKVLHKIFNKEILGYVIDAVNSTGKAQENYIIVGHCAQQVEDYVNNNYDSLLTVNGDITKETFPGVKKMCEEAYRYTAKEFKKDARYMGITRTL